MPILIKPFLFLLAFGQAAVLFASVIGLAGWLLTMLARAILVSANVPRPYLQPPQQQPKLLQHQR